MLSCGYKKNKTERDFQDLRGSVLSTICCPQMLLFHSLWKISILFLFSDYQRLPFIIQPQWIALLRFPIPGRLQSIFVKVFRLQWRFNCGPMSDLWNDNVTSHRSVYQTGKHQSRPAGVLKGCKQTKREKWLKSSTSHLFGVFFSTFSFSCHKTNSLYPSKYPKRTAALSTVFFICWEDGENWTGWKSVAA